MALIDVLRVASLVVCGLAPICGLAQSQQFAEPSIHWAYASYFGTGWYKISDERSAFILRVAPRWGHSEASIDEQGRRTIGYTFRIPVTMGLNKLNFDDLPAFLDPDNLTSLSINVGADADIPVTNRFSIRPNAEIGYGTILGEDASAWSYLAEFRSKYTFPSGKLDWSLLGGLGFVGYTPNEGSSDNFAFVSVGAEFTNPIKWPRSKDDQTLLHWHVIYTNYVDKIEFNNGLHEPDFLASTWELGVAIGKRDKPVRIWFLKFDRLGLGYRYSDNGDKRGITLRFRSIYDP